MPVPVIPDKEQDDGGGKQFDGPKIPTGIRRLQKNFGGGGGIADTWDGVLPTEPEVQPAPPQEEESSSDDEEEQKPPSDPFVLDLPLGQIVHEINRDDLISQINYEPEYISFVNQMQKKVFAGEVGELQKDYTHTFFSEGK